MLLVNLLSAIKESVSPNMLYLTCRRDQNENLKFRIIPECPFHTELKQKVLSVMIILVLSHSSISKFLSNKTSRTFKEKSLILSLCTTFYLIYQLCKTRFEMASWKKNPHQIWSFCFESDLLVKTCFRMASFFKLKAKTRQPYEANTSKLAGPHHSVNNFNTGIFVWEPRRPEITQNCLEFASCSK